MIRPLTLLCFCAFAGAGAWLYQVKHAVALKDRQLVEIRRETEMARQRIDILRAEWALLNEPERLRQTATRVLTLEPMQPQHFARAAEFERRLPAAVVFAGAPPLLAPDPVPAAPVATQAPQVLLASAPVATRPAQPAPAPAPAPAAAEPRAERVIEAPAPRALAAAVTAQRAEQAARAVTTPPARNAAPQPAPIAAPRPIQPAVHVAPAPVPAPSPTRMTQANPTSAVSVTRVAQTNVAPSAIASALGGASSLGRPMLAPPVPVSSAAAATLRGGGTPVPASVR